jgi:hypothetical protein
VEQKERQQLAVIQAELRQPEVVLPDHVPVPEGGQSWAKLWYCIPKKCRVKSSLTFYV